jgi:hypothetical protein
VALVIRTVEIFTIPAGWEDDSRSNTVGARLEREALGVFAIAWSKAFSVSKTAVADTGLHTFAAAQTWVSG